MSLSLTPSLPHSRRTLFIISIFAISSVSPPRRLHSLGPCAAIVHGLRVSRYTKPYFPAQDSSVEMCLLGGGPRNEMERSIIGMEYRLDHSR
jgi:hypothetical protein